MSQTVLSAPLASPAGSPVLAAAPHRIGAVTLVARDLPRLRAFYEEVLGLPVIEAGPGRASLDIGGTARLELRGDPAARPHRRNEAGLFHTAFLLPDRADLGAWLRRAAAQRRRLGGASDHGVSEALYLSDPEGNGIEIYVDRPESAWPRGPEGIPMPSEPLDLPGLLATDPARRWDGFPRGGTIGHVHLQVGEIAAAEAFYAGLLGFDVTCRYPGGSFYGSGGYHHQLASNVWQSAGAPLREGGATGLAEVVLLAAPAAIAAVRARLGQGGSGALALHDPWGTAILLRPAG
jgi:catechol 2,3-dioxygenase